MQLQDQYLQTLCKKCNRFISPSNYQTHEARCAGHFRINTYNQSRVPKKQGPQRKKIPCQFCSYQQTLAELKTHPLQCPYRQIQCKNCHQKVCLSDLDDHKIVCLEFQSSSPVRRSVNILRKRVWEEQRNSQFFDPQLIQLQKGWNRQNLRVSLISFYEREKVNIPQRRYQDQYINVRQAHKRQFSYRCREVYNQEDQYQNQNPHQHRDFCQEMARFNLAQRRGYSVRNSENRQMSTNRNRSNSLIRVVNNRHKQKQDKKKSSVVVKKKQLIKYKPKNLDQEPDLCAICYCQYKLKERVMSLPCKHLFHPDCINQWLKKKQLCPICKQSCGQNK